MMNLKKALFAAVASLGLVTSVAMAKNPADWPDKVRIGIIPTESNTAIQTRFKPLTDYLTKVLDVKIEIMSASDYASVIEAMRFKKIEIAYYGPKSYCEASDRANAEAVVVDKALDGTTGYYGIIISKKGSGINNMEDAKGKTFAFTDPNSTSGCLVPMVHFLVDLDVKPEKYFSKVMFSGSHEASMLSVKNGNIQVAATNDIDLHKAQDTGRIGKNDFNILWTSKQIVGSLWAVRGDLPASFKTAFRNAMINMKDKEYLETLGVMGWVPIDDSAYDSIRKVIAVSNRLKSGK